MHLTGHIRVRYLRIYLKNSHKKEKNKTLFIHLYHIALQKLTVKKLCPERILVYIIMASSLKNVRPQKKENGYIPLTNFTKPSESPANPKSKQGTCLNPKKTTISSNVINDQITCQRN